jgi:hypothetical protein
VTRDGTFNKAIGNNVRLASLTRATLAVSVTQVLNYINQSIERAPSELRLSIMSRMVKSAVSKLERQSGPVSNEIKEQRIVKI